MKYTLLALTAFALIAFPHLGLAHEHQIFKIGENYYDFTIGSLNEPIVVDDKTGVDLRVMQVNFPANEAGTPVTGLDTTLKVELSAGAEKKTIDLRPAFNSPGAYTAPFYPTVDTTYTYRVFGTLNDIPVDLSFTCNPAGHPQVEEDTSAIEVSERVMRVGKRGSFGCPLAKADLGFPEASASNIALQEMAAGAGTKGMLGIGIAILAFLAAIFAFRRK